MEKANKNKLVSYHLRQAAVEQ